MKPIYTSIPVGLCKYALHNRKTNHLKLYIYLKYVSSGHVKYSNYNNKVWATDIGKSEKWIRNALKWLITNKWITINSKRKSYRIIGYKQLQVRLGIKSLSAAIYEPDDFDKIRDFCCAVVITYQIRIKQLIKKNRRSVSNLEDTSMNRNFFNKGFYEMPLSYLAKSLGVSNTTANNYKQCAKESGYLTVKGQRRTLVDSKGRSLTIEHLSCIMATYPEKAGRLRIYKNSIKIIEADIIKSEIVFKRKRYKHREKK